MSEDRFDLVIVGGGIIGACAAFFAARENPSARILLVERSMAGSGATQFSVGLELPYGYTPLRRALALESRQLFDELRREVPRLPIRDLPLFGVASKARVETYIHNFVLPGVRAANSSEIENLLSFYPGLHLRDDVVITCGTATHTNPRDVACILLATARQRYAAEVWEGVAITAVEPATDGWNVVTADGRTLRSTSVLDATGPWMPGGPARSVAVNHGVRVKKVAAMQLDRPAAPDTPALFFFDDDAFLLPVPQESRWLFSFTLQVWDVSPEDDDRFILTAHDREFALEALERHMPGLVQHCTNARVFCDAYAPDWTPVIDHAGGAGWVAAGVGCGSGYRLAPAIAMRALNLLAADRDVNRLRRHTAADLQQ